jgi:HSP20 family protein
MNELSKNASQVPVVSPAIDVFESDEGYLVRADVPGVTDGGVQIEFQKDRLTLVATREAEPLRFERSIRFPDRVDADAIEAVLDAGVLELKLPKAAEVRPRKIPIRVTG